MGYQVVLTEPMARSLKDHLLSDQSCEQLAITLCGLHCQGERVRLLGRHLILLPKDAFDHQSAGGLELRQEVQQYVLKLAWQEGLSQVDWHTHPSDSPWVSFSGIDDRHEKELARYLARRIPGTLYGSVVMTAKAVRARIWTGDTHQPQAVPMETIRFGPFQPVSAHPQQGSCVVRERLDEMFSRQVLAFGRAFQERLSRYRVGLIGLGGTGSVVAEELSRLGVRQWVLIDDDQVEESNLNRLLGATRQDSQRGSAKVAVAGRNILDVAPKAEVQMLKSSLFEPEALQALKTCDLIVVCTDTHASRLVANRLSVQYLIPLVHVAVNIDVDEDHHITDISGEYVMPQLGSWCLQCAQVFDNQQAGWELASPEERARLRARGYVRDTPSPAVYHLNATMASVAVAEIHNAIYPYRPKRPYVVYDELKGEFMAVEMEPDSTCPVCTPEGVLGLGDLEPLPDYSEAGRQESEPVADTGKTIHGIDLSSIETLDESGSQARRRMSLDQRLFGWSMDMQLRYYRCPAATRMISRSERWLRRLAECFPNR